jgi:hypothetical protein
MAMLSYVLADAAADQRIVIGMLVVGLIFIGIIALGETVEWLLERRHKSVR